MNRSRSGILALAFVAACAEQPASTVARMPDGSRSGAALAAAAGEYLATPAGRYHRSCVHAIPDGAHVDSGGLVTRADGSTYQLPTCQYPAYPNFWARQAGQVNPLDFSSNTTRVEWAWDTLPSPDWAKKLTAYWAVPAAPIGSYPTGTVYYTFPGLEYQTMDAIVMPALQYGAGAFGGSYWTAASWYCRGSNCWYSAPQISPNVGDTVFGSIVASNCSHGRLGLTCDWTIKTKYSHGAFADSTTLSVTSVLGAFTIADAAAVDVDSVTSCSQYPASGVSYWHVWLYDSTGYKLQLGAVWWVDTVTSGVSPACYFGVTSNYDYLTSYHNDPPPTVSISGPNNVRPNADCVWQSNPSGGALPLTFEWYPWSAQVQDVTASLTASQWIKVVATDARSRHGSDSLYVTVSSLAPVCPT